MKKVVNISLGGLVFHLEEDAYERLSSYLQNLEKQFSHSVDSAEIMKDIESRIAEHFSQRITIPEMVIGLPDVEEVIAIMGHPSDFEEPKSHSESNSSSFRRTHRKLYRDPDGRIIGGVCSGLGYYWDVDPVLLRIIIVVLSLTGGGGLLIYLILWIVIPEAITVSQKLEMTGQEVNAENIGRSFHGSL